MTSASRPLWFEYLKNALVGAFVGLVCAVTTGAASRALLARPARLGPGLAFWEDFALLALGMVVAATLALAWLVFYEAWLARLLRRAGRLPDATTLRLCGLASLWSGGKRVQGLCYLTPFEFGFTSARDDGGAHDTVYRLADIDRVTTCRVGLLRWHSLRVRRTDGGELVVTPFAPRTWALRLTAPRSARPSRFGSSG